MASLGTHDRFLRVRTILRGCAVVIAGMNTVVRIPALMIDGPASSLRGFGRGTRLLTPDGPVPVEEIEPGEAVLDPDGRPHFVLWQGGWDHGTLPPEGAGQMRHAVVIAANAFGPGKPRRDLVLSQDMTVIVQTAGRAAAVAARTLVPHRARWDTSGRVAGYHVVVTRSPCLLMAENLPCQSHRPGTFGMAEQAMTRQSGIGAAPIRHPVVAQRR